MNKKELIAAIANESGVSKASVESVIASMENVVSDTVMKNGDSIRLPGFGTFSRKDVAARTARNPRTGESVAVPAKQKLILKFAKGYGETSE